MELYTNLLANLWLFASSGAYSYPIDSVMGGLYENLCACQRLFTSSGTDKSMYVPVNLIHLRYSNPFDSVLGGL